VTTGTKDAMRWAVAALGAVATLPGCDLFGSEPEAPPEVASPYEDDADAAAEIDAAVAAARADGKRVLLVFGGNWCVWCRRLEHVLRNHAEVRTALADGFHVVHVSTGGRRSGHNRALSERYGDPIQHGLPVLVVLDGSGRVVMTQETGSLEEGNRHDPERILQFLRRARQG
jgi:thiol:disulfide interchange protein